MDLAYSLYQLTGRPSIVWTWRVLSVSRILFSRQRSAHACAREANTREVDMPDPQAPVRALMARATGDEKHDASASSTLDVLWVLYDRVLRYDPRDPRSDGRDRFLLSKGHGPLALYAILAAKG